MMNSKINYETKNCIIFQIKTLCLHIIHYIKKKNHHE